MAVDNVHLKSEAKKYEFMAEETSGSLGGIKPIQPKSRRKVAYCSLRNEMERNEMKRNEMERNEMKICSLRNENL